MSTRGYIAIEHEDGTCDGFYNHYDNYPEGTGVILLSTPGCITGDLATIQAAVKNTEKDWVFKHHEWREALNEGNRHGCDWFYLRRKEVWYCSCYYSDNLFLDPVAEVLVREIKAAADEEYNWLKEKYEKLKAEVSK